MKKLFLICLPLFPLIQLEACEICDYLNRQAEALFCQMNDKCRSLDIDENYYVLLGKLEMLAEIKKNLPLCKEKS